jgi:hypothetical protein
MAHLVSRRQFTLGSLAAGASLALRPAVAAPRGAYPPVVPGTGVRIARTGDDFEASDWAYYPAHPKSSYNIDDRVREPGASSKNYLWVEGAKRGTPDSVRRVPAPPGGIEGSKGVMLVQTLHSGIPGDLSYGEQQDDLLHNVSGTVGSTIPVSWSPNCVCRVFIAPTSHWEHRDGASFGYRIGLLGFGRKSNDEEYWPGFFLHMERGLKNGERTYQIRTWVRADEGGRDMPSLTFEPASWITLGMSVTPDGACHFFARKGIEDLTKADCVGSYWCYNYRAHSFQTFFFNVINQDDGRNVSTPWIIDDAFLYSATPPASKVRMAGGTATTTQAAAQKPTPQPAAR